MSATLATLPKGHEFPVATFTLERSWVDAYAAATGDNTTFALGEDLVPAMALATLSIRALLTPGMLAPGTLHAGQEVSFTRALKVGEEVAVAARIVSRGERAGWVLMSVDLEAQSGDDIVMSGRATVSFPQDGGP